MSDLIRILTIADSYSDDDWRRFARDLIYPMESDFYLFAEDPTTGLADSDRESDEMIAARTNLMLPNDVGGSAGFSQFVHNTVFKPSGRLFRPVRGFYAGLSRRHPKIYAAAAQHERLVKRLLFDCQDCGDCALATCLFNCPSSSCRKNQRNGPCGGSRGITCEIADAPCLWYRAYHRAKYHGLLKDFLRGDLVTTNHRLRHTSSWANYFDGNDHVGLADEHELPPPLIRKTQTGR